MSAEQRIREAYAAPKIEPLKFRERPDGRVAVDVRQMVFSTDGRALSDERLVHVYAFRDGLIAGMDVH